VSDHLGPVWDALRASKRAEARALQGALPTPWNDVAAALIDLDVGRRPSLAFDAPATWQAAWITAHQQAEGASQEGWFGQAMRWAEDDRLAQYEVALARGRCRHERRAYGPALADAKLARELARRAHHPGREAWALSLAGTALVEQRDYARARAVHEAAHALHTAAGQPGGEVAALGGLGLCAIGRHETARGAESLHRAVALARTHDLEPEERAWLACVAHAMGLLDRNDARRDALVRLAELERRADAPLRAAAAWIDAATAATAILALDDAEAALQHAAACYVERDHEPGLQDVERRLASLSTLREGLPARRARWTQAITLRAPPSPPEA
jgi:hypothetical protein